MNNLSFISNTCNYPPTKYDNYYDDREDITKNFICNKANNKIEFKTEETKLGEQKKLW